MADWHVYIIECADGTLYTGVATDVARRVREHDAGRGARYTRGRRPVALRYEEPAASRSVALRREAAIKRLSRDEKLRLAAHEEKDAPDEGVSDAMCVPRKRTR